MKTSEWMLKVLIRESRTVHLSLRCALHNLPRGRAEDVREVTLFPHEVGDFMALGHPACRKCARLLIARYERPRELGDVPTGW